MTVRELMERLVRYNGDMEVVVETANDMGITLDDLRIEDSEEPGGLPTLYLLSDAELVTAPSS